MEEQHMDDILPVMRNTIASAVTAWLQTLKKFDVALNQHHDISNYHGRHVVAKFMLDVVEPATNYSNMVREQLSASIEEVKHYNGETDTPTNRVSSISVNIKAIMDKISTLVNKFDADVSADIKSKTGGKAYTKGVTQSQPQKVDA